MRTRRRWGWQMNSRQRRNNAAREHNERFGLVCELKVLRSSIYAKHGFWVSLVVGATNDSLRREIDRLRVMLSAVAPPANTIRHRGVVGVVRASAPWPQRIGDEKGAQAKADNIITSSQG